MLFKSTSKNYLYTGQYTNEMFSVSSNLNNLEFSHDVAENNGVKVELHSDLFQSSNMHEQRRVERRKKRKKRKQRYYTGRSKTRKSRTGLRKDTTKSDEKCVSNIEHSRNIHIDQNIDSNTNAFFPDRLHFLFQTVLKTVLNVLDPPHECSSGATNKNILNPGYNRNEISSISTNKNNFDSVNDVAENTGDKIQLHSELTQSSLLENDLSQSSLLENDLFQSSLLIPKENERLSNIISKLKRRVEEKDDTLETKLFPALKKMNIATEKTVSQSVDSLETVLDPPNECSSESRNKNNLNPNLHTDECSFVSTNKNNLGSSYGVAENTGDNIQLPSDFSQSSLLGIPKENRRLSNIINRLKQRL
ncbi:hypothetical protein HNY73_011286 [Argiope bruennichi]|uniref:Uncharacterized protein n=1 Tax=Argiope bruennichi TaxID=94029 RepID=A0A8T0F4L5_ARGBR|nr:hypothetical protein HNY73_011286 [Argiope bruennichi]